MVAILGTPWGCIVSEEIPYLMVYPNHGMQTHSKQYCGAYITIIVIDYSKPFQNNDIMKQPVLKLLKIRVRNNCHCSCAEIKETITNWCIDSSASVPEGSPFMVRGGGENTSIRLSRTYQGSPVQSLHRQRGPKRSRGPKLQQVGGIQLCGKKEVCGGLRIQV